MAEKEYIERETIEKAFAEEIRTNYLDDYAKGFQSALLAIMSIPSADVAPVRHGRWKKSKGNERPTENGFVHDDRYVCDCCGWGCCCETKLDFSFCPNCGARMDGDKND